MVSLKRKRLSLSEKYKAITEVASGTKPSKVAEKYDVPRYTRSAWLQPENKEKIESAFQSIEVSAKKRNLRVGQSENLEKGLFGLT